MLGWNRTRLLGGLGVVAASLLTAGGIAANAAGAALPPAPGFHLLWDQTTAGVYLSTPVTATLEGRQATVVGADNGLLYAFATASGAPIPGWPVRTDAANYTCASGAPCPYNATGVNSPVSAGVLTGNQSSIFVEAGGGNAITDSPSQAKPDFEAYTDTGVRLYATDPSETTTDNLVARPGVGSNPGLSGVALGLVGGHLYGFAGGTTSHLQYGIRARTGATAYAYVNQDTSNGTPAFADIDGTKAVYEVSDASYSPTYPGSFAGGHLRVFTPTGREVCNRDLDAPSAHDNYAENSFVTSPAVGSLGGVPLVVFGQGNRYPGSDQIVAYDAACQPVWPHPPTLAGPTNFSPVIADTGGPGQPTVVAEARDPAGHPVIYEISGSGRILRQRTLRSCRGINPYTTSQSVTTADLTGLGYQDIVAPAGTCGYAVLDGRTLQFVPTGSPSGFLYPTCAGSKFDSYSTAVITPTPTAEGSVAVTVAGFRVGTDLGCVASYAIRGVAGHPAGLGAGAWPEFHHDPQLTGVAGTTPAPVSDVLGPGASLPSGGRLTAPGGRVVAVLRVGGNLQVGLAGPHRLAVRFSTRTRARPHTGRLTMQGNGNLVLRSSGGKVLWQSRSRSGLPAFSVIQPNGSLVVYEGPPPGNEANEPVAIWSSRRGLIRRH